MKKLSRISQEMGICVQNMAKKYGIMIGREYMGESGGLYEFYGYIYVSLWEMYNRLEYEPFRKLMNGYFIQFGNKHGLVLDKWVNNIVKFDNYYFSIEDIIYDIHEKVKRHLIKQWQDDLKAYNKGKDESEYKYVNFRTYCLGFRYSDLEN